MEIDAMTEIWRRYDARLNELVQTQAQLMRRGALAVAQTAFDRLRRTLRIEIIQGAIVVLLLGAFAADHAGDVPVLLASVALDGYAIAILASTVAQLVALAKIDYDEPVIAIARTVERLKLLRARTIMWTLVPAPLMWPALAIAGARGLFAVEPIATFGLSWVFANVAFGVAVLLTALFVARRYGSSARPASWFVRFSDSISGTEVRAAALQLQALLRYETNEAEEIRDQ